MNETNVTITPATLPTRFIAVTDRYGLVPDSHNYTLYELVTVDPRKSPNYKSDGQPVTLRQEWRQAKPEFHASLSPAGLRHVLSHIAYKSAISDAEQTTIQRYIASLNEWVARIEALNIPEVSGR